MERRGFIALLLAAFASPPVSRSARNSRTVLVQTSPLAGFQYHEGAKLWPSLAVGQALALVRERQNPFDRRAVRIDWQGHKLGYVPRAENAALAQMLDRGERLEARIAALREAIDPWQRMKFDVVLSGGEQAR